MATATATATITPPQGWETVTKRGKAKIKPAALPKPLIKSSWNPRTWARLTANTAQTFALVFAAAYCGMLIGAALYYLILEKNPTITAHWHALVPSDYWRHLVRDSGEGFFGGLFGMFVGWNHYKPRKAQLSKFEEFISEKLGLAIVGDADPLSGWQFTKACILCPFFALPGAVVFGSLVALGHYHVIDAQALMNATGFSLPSNKSILGAAVSFFLTGLPVKIVGLGAAHFYGRRVLRGAFDDLQLWVAEFVRALGKLTFETSGFFVKLLTPPAFQARCNELSQHNDLGDEKPSIPLRIILVLLTCGGLYLMYEGANVIFVIARR